jgi:hypothetical protein
MQLTRQHVIDVLRKAGLPDMAEEALHALPDPVDSEQALSTGRYRRRSPRPDTRRNPRSGR